MRLEVDALTVRYGHTVAVCDLSFRVEPGEIVALLGANGAGKTSTLRAIMGLAARAAGRVVLDGVDTARMATHRLVRLGVAAVPEGRHVFADQTVIANLTLGAHVRRRGLGAPHLDESVERVFAIFPVLGERRRQLAGTLSGGEQQMLAIGRALMSGPRLLLLDEPSLGLAPRLAGAIFATLEQLRAGGLTVLVVEQRAHLALAVADRAYVVETGRLVLSGPAAQLRLDPGVVSAYLGEGE